jgi:hypothetical protein
MRVRARERRAGDQGTRRWGTACSRRKAGLVDDNERVTLSSYQVGGLACSSDVKGFDLL